MRVQLTVGSPVWIDRHHRGGVDAAFITSETTRSWVVSQYGREFCKIPKNHTEPTFHVRGNGSGTTVWLDSEYMADQRWFAKHKSLIARAVESLRDAETLKAVAKLVGYEEGK